MKLCNIITAIAVGMIGWQTGVAAPEDDYPGFYADVPWGIPAGLEADTVPTKYAPSTAPMGYNLRLPTGQLGDLMCCPQSVF